MMVLIRYCNFSRIPSAKQKYISNSFTESRLTDDQWARTLQLMKALLVYGSSHQLRTGPTFFRPFEDRTFPFL